MVINENYKLNNKPIYLNTIDKFNKFIYLLHTENHFNVITSMARYLNKSYFCDLCKKGFDHYREHTCANTCKACGRLNCREDFRINCKICNIIIKNKSCFDLHNESKCSIVNTCDECLYFISKSRPHVCGDNEKWCTNCNEVVDITHKCFIKTAIDTLSKKPFSGYIFFDFESYLD